MPKIKELKGESCCGISLKNMLSFWDKIEEIYQLGQPGVQGGRTSVQPAWTQVCPQWTGVGPTISLKCDIEYI